MVDKTSAGLKLVGVLFLIPAVCVFGFTCLTVIGIFIRMSHSHKSAIPSAIMAIIIGVIITAVFAGPGLLLLGFGKIVGRNS